MAGMKNIAFALLFLLAFSASATAAEFTIAPYPKHGLKATPEEWVSALEDLDAVNATGLVITKTWAEMEPKKRIYKKLNDVGHDFSENAKAGRQVLFGFQPINTVKRDMPPDLMKTAWDDPAMIGRFQEWLDHLMLEQPAAPKYISLSNEADIYFEKHPKELDAFLKFFAAAQTVVKRNAFPSARLGVTVTFEGLRKGRGAIIQKLLEASEVAIFTYYPMLELKALPIENVAEHLDEIVKASGEKDIVLQEVGYPSGAAVQSSPEKQAAFFKAVIPAIQSREQIKFASLFLLHDFDPELCGKFATYYGFEKAPAEPKKKFLDFLCTLGMKTTEGAEKPAWAVVKEALK